MGRLAFEAQIRDRLRGAHHLQPVFSNTYRIPERLREFDKNLFVVFNYQTGKFEVHSLANKGSTYCMDVPFRELDSRIEGLIRKGWLAARGRQIFSEIDEDNERLKASNERKNRNDLAGIAEEMHPYFRDEAWR